MATLNGTAARHPYRVRHPASPAVDPMLSVMSMGLHVPNSVFVAVLVAFTILFHGGVAAGGTAAALFSEIPAWNRMVRDEIAFKLGQSYEVEVEKAKPPEPPPPPPEPEKEEPKPAPKELPKDQPPPPPAPAEAARVIATDPDPNTPADMTDTIVQGNADKYAGGVTTNNGTSKTAVTSTAATPTGVPGGTGTAAAPTVPKIDRSRKASLLGSVDWSDCPFPAEADAEQIDQAFVMIQVKVKPDGNPDSVTVVQDPGHGFGREARKCAMRKKFTSALDPDGNPIPAVTNAFRVRFER